MNSSSHGKISVDPSGFAEPLAGSSNVRWCEPAFAAAPVEGHCLNLLPSVHHVDSGVRSKGLLGERAFRLFIAWSNLWVSQGFIYVFIVPLGTSRCFTV